MQVYKVTWGGPRLCRQPDGGLGRPVIARSSWEPLYMWGRTAYPTALSPMSGYYPASDWARALTEGGSPTALTAFASLDDAFAFLDSLGPNGDYDLWRCDAEPVEYRVPWGEHNTFSYDLHGWSDFWRRVQLWNAGGPCPRRCSTPRWSPGTVFCREVRLVERMAVRIWLNRYIDPVTYIGDEQIHAPWHYQAYHPGMIAA